MLKIVGGGLCLLYGYAIIFSYLNIYGIDICTLLKITAKNIILSNFLI